MFCSVWQFKTRENLLIGELEDVVDPTKKEYFLMLDDRPTQKSTTLEVKAKSFHYMRAPFIYYSDLRLNRLYHMSVTDCTILFCLKGLSSPEMLQ